VSAAEGRSGGSNSKITNRVVNGVIGGVIGGIAVLAIISFLIQRRLPR